MSTLRSGGRRYMAYLEANPGSTVAEVCAALGRPRNDSCKRMLAMSRSGHLVRRVDAGVGRYWIAAQKAECAAWEPLPLAPDPVARDPAPSAPPAYPLQVAAARVGQMHPGRVEQRMWEGRLVPYTICPRPVEQASTVQHAPPRVRVNLSSKWGDL